MYTKWVCFLYTKVIALCFNDLDQTALTLDEPRNKIAELIDLHFVEMVSVKSPLVGHGMFLLEKNYSQNMKHT
ncbi:MAG: hypothetical protein AB8B53_01925 [Flavobacteriales bacterium]